MEGRIGLGLLVGLFQLEDVRHQGLGDEAAAEDAEMPALVGTGAEGIGLSLSCHGLSCLTILRHVLEAGCAPNVQ